MTRLTCICTGLFQRPLTRSNFPNDRKAIVLEKLGNRAEAMSTLVESVTKFPYNWSAWLKLSVLMERPEEVCPTQSLVRPGLIRLSSIAGRYRIPPTSKFHVAHLSYPRGSGNSRRQ